MSRVTCSKGWTRFVYGAGRAIRIKGRTGQIWKTQLCRDKRKTHYWKDLRVLAELRHDGRVWTFVSIQGSAKMPKRTFADMAEACDFYNRFYSLDPDCAPVADLGAA